MDIVALLMARCAACPRIEEKWANICFCSPEGTVRLVQASGVGGGR